MKKIILTLLFTMVAVFSYAQNNDNLKMQIIGDNRSWLNEEYKSKFQYPVTAGVSVFYDASIAKSNIGTYNQFHHGGGAALTSKLSFSKCNSSMA